MSVLPDFVVIGQEPWDDVERRNQLLVRALAERNPETRFLFAEIPFRPSQRRSWRPPRVRRITANVWAVRAIRPLPDRFRRVADRAEAAQVRRAMRQVGVHRPLLWSQDSRAGDLVRHLEPERIVFDLTDDWAAFEADPRRHAAMQRRIEAFGARAEVVFACSRALAEGARAWASRVVLLPNAVEPPGEELPPPDRLAELPRPRLGYVGSLHSTRLDVPMLAAAAQLKPDWTFALLGPDMLEPAHHETLAGLPNVHFLGTRPHSEVRAYVQALDVCLIPHLVNDFTNSLDPLKLYEYLAAGRPVISTPVELPDELRHVVQVVEDAEGLVAAAAIAAEWDGPRARAARQALMRGQTWRHRAERIEVELGVRSRGPRRPGVTVAIVSHNTRDLLERCLDAVRAASTPSTQVVVVDNASSDGSPAMVRERFPDVQVIELDENAGFARANNVAFARCDTELFLLLNSDAFVEPDTLEQLVRVADAHPEAAAVGPRLSNPDGSLQRSAWPFPSAGRLLIEAVGLHRLLRRTPWYEDLGLWAHDEERVVDFLVGACLLVRSDAYEAVGGFDERYWLYAEESDLQKRMADRGRSVVFTPATQVVHLGGASSTVRTAQIDHFYAGQRRFLRAHGGPYASPAGRLALLVGSALRGRWTALRSALRSAPRR